MSNVNQRLSLGSRSERSSRLAERICLAILEGRAAEGLTDRDILAAVPSAIARYIAITFQAADRHHRLAAAEAIFRYLGRTLLSIGYDQPTIGRMLGCSDAAEVRLSNGR
jgi:hypothetical protein